MTEDTVTIIFNGKARKLTMDITCLDLDSILQDHDKTWQLMESFNKKVIDLYGNRD